MIAQATGRSTALNELIRLDSLIAPDSAFGGCLSRELTQRAPAVLRRFLKMLDLPVPVAKGAGEPVIFESMIERWAKYTNATKRGGRIWKLSVAASPPISATMTRRR